MKIKLSDIEEHGSVKAAIEALVDDDDDDDDDGGDVEVIEDGEEVSEETMRLLENAVEDRHVYSDIITRCTCSCCGCNELATHYDSDASDRFCAACTEYVCDDDGEVLCSRDERTEHVSDGGRIYLRRRTRTPEMPEEDPDGEYCLYWNTVGDESRVMARFATREEAEQAVAAADWPPPEDCTPYFCEYCVRVLVDGQWIVDED